VEHTISEVARMTGTTSRTLRHYDEVGLVAPCRVGSNGYRFYDDAALRRLQRVLLLRQLGLGIPAIAEVLDSADDLSALSAHLEWLRAERARLDRQIASVQRTISSMEREEPMMAQDMFDGFDHTRYEEEVQRRWGTQAWAQSDRWWRDLNAQERQSFLAEHAAIAAGWARLREADAPVDGPDARALARRHRAWIAAGWGGRQPAADELCGLAEMYVADERFAANYGGAAGAAYVRDALIDYAVAELT
jgi:DNA-binding transcriptional MerR regulator